MQPLLQTDVIFHSLVKEMNKLINENVIVTNETGVIVASTQEDRIGDYHEGAYLSMKNRVSMVMTKELSETLQGVKRGIVLPIIVEEKPFGVLGITGNPEEVEPYARLVQKMAELFIKGSSEQISQEKLARNMELFVFDWLNGTIQDEFLLERADFFRLPIKAYKQVISIHIPNAVQHLSYKEMIELRKVWDQKKRAIIIRWGEGKLLIIDREYKHEKLSMKLKNFLQQTKDIIGEEASVGVGKPTDYINLKQSHEQAERACKIAQKEKRIIFEVELRFEMIQHEISQHTKLQYISRTIAPIAEEDVLIKTLKNWFEHDMSIQNTAATLHIHKNTLYYRLEQVEKRTGLSIQKTGDLMLLYIGLRFLQEFA